MFSYDKMASPVLGLRGLEADLSEEELAIQGSAHRFAKEVMRPIAAKLDKSSPEEVVAEDSPVWTYIEKMQASGILDLETFAGMSNEQSARIFPIIFEELGWGDPGLCLLSMVMGFPAHAALGTGDPELIERFKSLRGCWVGTQPDRGSDMVDTDKTEAYVGSQHNFGNLIARVEGDELVINGQSSAWVSGAPLAECALLYCQCDYGEGIYREDGGHHLVAALVPFDIPGVSKGKPLDKIGQRSLPQGEVFFDEVRIPKKYVIAGKESAIPNVYGAITFGNMEMSAIFTGVARAAFDHALAYVHERKQGGTVLIEHQSVRMRIFDMWRKVESSRAMCHRAVAYNYSDNGPHLLSSITAKTLVTQNAFDVASEALQLFGGNGLTAEYPLEKILRDARASLIEDGENYLLSLKGATWISKWYKDK